jgi:hypothetical protein
MKRRPTFGNLLVLMEDGPHLQDLQKEELQRSKSFGKQFLGLQNQHA